MAANMAVVNSVVLSGIFGSFSHQLSVFVIIGQFSRSMKYGNGSVMIAMKHDPDPHVMTAIFVWRNLKFQSFKTNAVVSADRSFFLNAKDVIDMFYVKIWNERLNWRR